MSVNAIIVYRFYFNTCSYVTLVLKQCLESGIRKEGYNFFVIINGNATALWELVHNSKEIHVVVQVLKQLSADSIEIGTSLFQLLRYHTCSTSIEVERTHAHASIEVPHTPL